MKIEYLKIFCRNLHEQESFYGKVLNLPVKQLEGPGIEVKLGYSILEIEQREDATPYHLAFHIPSGRETTALDWLNSKLEILKHGEEEIIDFPAWNAKSIYFYDADKNILEFISRRELFPARIGSFSAEEILGISEVGLATEDVQDKFNFMNEHFGLQKYSGDYKRFCAVGDDEGLFIVIDKNQKDWIPTGDKAFASPFEIKISVEKALFGAAFKNERLELL